MGKLILLIIILLVTVYSVWKGYRQLTGPEDDLQDANSKEDKHDERS